MPGTIVPHRLTHRLAVPPESNDPDTTSSSSIFFVRNLLHIQTSNHTVIHKCLPTHHHQAQLPDPATFFTNKNTLFKAQNLPLHQFFTLIFRISFFLVLVN
ncbi:hypothetical protein Pst134EB_018171 [Puccinia striiformis f. sp. tritici]|nr:hypothetical protein Pst134EB_018171 [Puccinia striiformis f. sp. tritici]